MSPLPLIYHISLIVCSSPIIYKLSSFPSSTFQNSILESLSSPSYQMSRTNVSTCNGEPVKLGCPAEISIDFLFSIVRTPTLKVSRSTQVTKNRIARRGDRFRNTEISIELSIYFLPSNPNWKVSASPWPWITACINIFAVRSNVGRCQLSKRIASSKNLSCTGPYGSESSLWFASWILSRSWSNGSGPKHA